MDELTLFNNKTGVPEQWLDNRDSKKCYNHNKNNKNNTNNNDGDLLWNGFGGERRSKTNDDLEGLLCGRDRIKR